MEDKRLGQWVIVMVIGAILLIILFAFRLGSASANEEGRPRYTLSYPRAAFVFENHDSFPFQIINEMCWNSSEGFACDERMNGDERPLLIWTVTDWHSQKTGEIYMIGDSCYWWMYQPEYGEDEQPHVAEHYWISCPE